MEHIGTIAALLTTLSFIPQVILVIKTKNTSAISLPMYLMFVTGVFCWTIYGLMINEPPVYVANIITLCLSSIVLGYKLTEKKR